jgi:hypothetical protein
LPQPFEEAGGCRVHRVMPNKLFESNFAWM